MSFLLFLVLMGQPDAPRHGLMFNFGLGVEGQAYRWHDPNFGDKHREAVAFAQRLQLGFGVGETALFADVYLSLPIAPFLIGEIILATIGVGAKRYARPGSGWYMTALARFGGASLTHFEG